MQVLQAGIYRLIFLELDAAVISDAAKQAGFQTRISDSRRSLILDLTAANRQSPLLLFDAADPANLGWFSRCQFYVDGRSGQVLQTPFMIANLRDRQGRAQAHGLRLRIARELPESFRLPGRQSISEQLVYVLLFNFLTSLAQTGVAVCGSTSIKPLAGRTESVGPRN